MYVNSLCHKIAPPNRLRPTWALWFYDRYICSAMGATHLHIVLMRYVCTYIRAYVHLELPYWILPEGTVCTVYTVRMYCQQLIAAVLLV